MRSRAIVCLLLLAIAGLGACKKTEADQTLAILGSCGSPPDPVLLVLLDKQGHNVVTTATDQVVISYADQGQLKTVPCTLVTLLDATTRQPTTKYPGLAVGCGLGGYSLGPTNPIKTFHVQVNGQDAGTIYYDLQPNTASTPTYTGVRDCFSLVSFQFNTLPVQIDDTVMPFAGVLPCNL